jgi:Planctomycete cytochrome C/WD domain, G-beta repeat
VEQLTTEQLELTRNIKKAQQDQQAAEARVAAEQEALTKATAAREAADTAKTAADDALAKAREGVNPDLPQEQKSAAEKAVAEAVQKRDETAKALADAMAAEQAAQQTLEATRQTIARSKKVVETGNPRAKALIAEGELVQQQVSSARQQLAEATANWIQHQLALEADLRRTGEWVSFTDEIAPILHQRCVACHNGKTAEGRLNLASFAALMKGGESGSSIEPGDHEYSTLVMMVEDGSMPKDADPLTEEQVALVSKWVDLGAHLDAGVDPARPLIRVMARPRQPAPPETYRVPVPVTATAFSPDGLTLATSGYHEVLLWKVADGTLLRRIGDLPERVYDLEFHSDGERLAVAAGIPGQMGEVRIVKAGDGSLVHDLVRIEDAAFAATFSPDGTRLAMGGADRAIRIFDVATGVEQVLIEDHADWVLSVAWSPDGTRLASGSRDSTAKLFDAATGDAQATFNGHGDVVYAVGFLPDGTHVASAGADNRIRTWAVENAAQKQEIRSHGGDVFQLQVLPGGESLTCGEDRTARLHTLADGKEIHKFEGHQEWIYAASAHAETKRVATGSYDGEIRLWNIGEAKPTLTFRAAPGLEQVSTPAP